MFRRSPMKLTTKGRYAVMAMAGLASHSTHHEGNHNAGHGETMAIPLSDIAGCQGIYLPYPEQIMAGCAGQDLSPPAGDRAEDLRRGTGGLHTGKNGGRSCLSAGFGRYMGASHLNMVCDHRY
ncbi:MAG: hypothetical protein V6Z81_08125 [Parvularculales bacterium]